MGKQCRVCKGDIVNPYRSTQIVCSPACSIAYMQEKRKRDQAKRLKKKAIAFKAETRKRREAIMTLSDHAELAQKAVNAYVLVRDQKRACVSCGTTEARWNAGHYRPVSVAKQLRYNTLNIWKQCVRCNKEASRTASRY